MSRGRLELLMTRQKAFLEPEPEKDASSNTCVLMRLEVSDDGLGILASELERLRQPFQRGLAVQHLPGSGLGLTLVNAVMESHNGRLGLSRAEEGGLRGVLEIPMMR